MSSHLLTPRAKTVLGTRLKFCMHLRSCGPFVVLNFGGGGVSRLRAARAAVDQCHEISGSLKRENELWLRNARDFALVQILPRKDLGNSAMKK